MPAQSVGPLKVRPLAGDAVPLDTVRSVAAEHPVLYRVNTTRLSLTQTVSLNVHHHWRRCGWRARSLVLAAGEFNGQRVVTI